MKRAHNSNNNFNSSSYSLNGINNSLSEENEILSIDDAYDQHIAEVIESSILRKIQYVLDNPRTNSIATQTDPIDHRNKKNLFSIENIFLMNIFFYSIALFICFCLIIKFIF